MTLPISLPAVDAAVRNRLFQQYVEPRLAAIRRSVEIMTFAGEDADDNLQEVLLHLLDVIPQYDPTQTASSTWIGRVVTNFMNDLHDRQAVRRRRNPDVSSYDDPSTSSGQAGSANCIYNIAGQRVTLDGYKGIVIVNGRKFVNK